MSSNRVSLRLARLLRSTKRLLLTMREEEVDKYGLMLTQLQHDYDYVKSNEQLSDELLQQYGQEIEYLSRALDAKRGEEVVPSTAEEEEVVVVEADVHIQTIRHKHKTTNALEVRRQLLSSGWRSSTDAVAESEEASLSRQREQQEQLTLHFAQMTRALKDNVTVAGHVIREDTSTLAKSLHKADENKHRLEHESMRLAKAAYQSCCDCGLVCVVMLVMWTFIVMVVFMRIFPKPLYARVVAEGEGQHSEL